MYCDWSLNKSTSQNDLTELIISAISDGYKILAINHHYTGIVPNEKPIPVISVESIKETYSKCYLQFLNCENPSLINWSKIQILSRLTVEIADQKAIFQFANPNQFIKSFDILSMKPTNDEMFEAIWTSDWNCDMISLNFDKKFSLLQKKNLITSSMSKNMFYEIEYGNFMVNNESRNMFISNFMLFFDICKGKNMLLCSNADNYFMHRSPFDILTVFETIFELKHHELKPMITTNCEKVVLKGIQRRYYKNVWETEAKDKNK